MEIRYRTELYKLLTVNPVTVELGVAEGLFTEHILKHWNPSLHYAVDNWSPIGLTGDGSFDQEWHKKNYNSAMERIKPFGEKCVVLRGPTWQMAQKVKDKSIDLVYLDADHSYEGVRKDLQAWWPKLKPGGVCAGHDMINPAYGVLQAVNEMATRYGLKVNIIHEDKDEDAGFWMYKPK